MDLQQDPEAPRRLLRELFDAAVLAAQPEHCVPPWLPEDDGGPLLVLGAGKAAAAMARAVEAHWSGPLSGLVVTRYGHGLPTRHIEVVEAAHPVPDEAGERAARRILELARAAGPGDRVLCLISGGGSSLLSLPAEGVSLACKQTLTGELLRCGAAINEINTVRKHLSAIKGGRLAEALAPAESHTLVISDVPGDDPSVIASGPTVPDASTSAQALAVLERYGIEIPLAVRRHLEDPASETPKPGAPCFQSTRLNCIATPALSLRAAARRARERGVAAAVLSDRIEGEARDLGALHAELAHQARRGGGFGGLRLPLVLLSGGETTVTVTGKGRGGRNAEFLLGAALNLDDVPGIHALACDTDGIDGTEDNAGALYYPGLMAEARARQLDGRQALADHDAYGFFQALNGLVVTGPTHTNVNDFRAFLILG
ncbi:glycerate kinase type-2 family protein [Alloalcanivorax xenomutans]|uniref:Glycerate kinase n=1 Tax=Alloalcanivorax xenomutans TaxID=1094342 RepID=A0A9Q3ZH00_9GAMM|nr:glycerate kinase [Alloalcanivorax xenomutans]MCE7508052.1 glycerate kinase [Alloalcanivorax xenomutans]MCE7523307.1 glycerate kinase [Alloalcanivorax xenomutans]WOA31229.1 glycerate kinase [Alloalcanivorax xenomutans]